MLLISIILSGLLSNAVAETVAGPTAIVRSISIFRNEIQLDIEKNHQIKIGTKIIARTAVNHKCLLIIKKVVRDLAYADATQCPGYATLRKGQTVSVTPDDEVNEEIKSVPPSPLDKG